MYIIVQIGSTGALKIIIDLVLCIIRSHQKDIKLYVLDPFHLQRANKLSKVYKPLNIYSQEITQKEHLLIQNSETTQNLNIYLYNYQTETAIFLAIQSMKKQLWHAVIQILKNISFILVLNECPSEVRGKACFYIYYIWG